MNFESIITADRSERYVLIYKNRSVFDSHESIAVYKIAGKRLVIFFEALCFICLSSVSFFLNNLFATIRAIQRVGC